MQRMSRWFGIILIVIGVVGLIVFAIASLIVVAISIAENSWRSLFGLTILFILFGAVFFGVYRIGRRLAALDPTSRAICADHFSDTIIGRSAVLTSFGIPPAILKAGEKREGVVFLVWLSATMFTLAVLLLIGALFFMIFLLGVSGLSGHGAPGFFLAIALGMLGLAGLLIWPTRALRRLARNRLRMSIQEIQDKDQRPTILFLRAFADDRVLLPPPRVTWRGRLLGVGRSESNLDTMLLEEGTEYGPVVALGSPNHPVPPYGAARGYFDHADWKAGAMRLAEQAYAIVICLEDSEGVRWEVENLLGPYFEKTLFLLHPRFLTPKANLPFIEQLLDWLPTLEAHRAELLACGNEKTATGVLGFFVGGDGALMLGRSSTFSRFAYLLMLRWFLLP